MKIINGELINPDYNKSDLTWYVCREVNKGFLQYMDEFENAYGINPAFIRLDRSWGRILSVFDYDIHGKKMLDLGCGSTGNTMESTTFKKNIFQPFLGRFIYGLKDKIGMDYVGVDIGDLSKEKFSNMQLNLLEKDCLTSNFSDGEFDLVLASSLFNSPELEKQVTNVEIKEDASYETSLILKANLLPQIERILKSDGIFLWYGGEHNLFDDY